MNRPYSIFLAAAVLSVLLTIFFYTSESHLLWREHVPSWKGNPSRINIATSKNSPVEALKDVLEPPTTTTTITTITKLAPPSTTLTEIPAQEPVFNETAAGQASDTDDAIADQTSGATDKVLDQASEPDSTDVDQSSKSNEVAEEQIPQAALVIATVRKTNNSWLDKELNGLLGPGGRFMPYIYLNDDPTAPLHTPKNRGHEAMVYLSYIIDNYDSLLPINIFIHGHRTAWHNNLMLGYSTSQMLQRLQFDKVVKDGYFNLRCHFNPGCPEHLYPFTDEYNADKAEELLIKDAWQEVFEVPEWQVPRVLAQPCCAQFAVTAERIRFVPREKYVHFRDWLTYTPMSDYMTGRVFEYFWQYIFDGSPVWCPDPRVCYCEGYGVCYEDPQDYDEWMDLNHKWGRLEKRLNNWKKKLRAGQLEKREIEGGYFVEEAGDAGDFSFGRMQRRELEQQAEQWIRSAPDRIARRKAKRDAAPVVPADQGEWLLQEMDKIEDELGKRIQQALDCGAKPACKAAAMKATEGLINPLSEDPGRAQKKKKKKRTMRSIEA